MDFDNENPPRPMSEFHRSLKLFIQFGLIDSNKANMKSRMIDKGLPKVDFFRPKRGQLLTDGQLVDPVLSVD